ncbi:MAG: glucoamylase precursor [Frankiales bacterium]|nr:glucoamylase precursor [Frankiales bacterium]
MIRIVGGPERVLVDAEALSGDTAQALARLGLPVVRIDDHDLTLGGISVAVFGREHPAVPHCTAWYVGPGDAPGWMLATVATAAQVLNRIASAFEQERAGAAFRAAGAGLEAPALLPCDPEVLRGVARSLAPAVPAVEALLRQSFDALERCCAASGAITAAPRAAPGEPDYWFTWQRDAAAVGFALRDLAVRGPADLRERARRRLDGYVAFLTGLTGDLSASRRTVDGDIVGGYGDPQHDGPAATALLLQAVAPDASERFVRHLIEIGEAPGYDLWENAYGRSFHARNLRRRALLRAGIACAAGSPPADAGAVGSAVLGFDPLLDDLHAVSAVVLALELDAERWPVNATWRLHHAHGAGIGRFPDDANDGYGSTGGGPWPVCSLWLAQHHLHSGHRAEGEGHLAFVLAHTDPTAISEQLDPVTGQPRGARGLAWAHAELVTTLLAAT